MKKENDGAIKKVQKKHKPKASRSRGKVNEISILKLNSLEVYNLKEPLQKLRKQEFPFAISRELTNLFRKINEELIPVEEERVRIAKKYAGKALNVPPEKIGEFLREFSASIVTGRVEIPFKKIPRKLEDIITVPLSSLDQENLDILFDK